MALLEDMLEGDNTIYMMLNKKRSCQGGSRLWITKWYLAKNILVS